MINKPVDLKKQQLIKQRNSQQFFQQHTWSRRSSLLLLKIFVGLAFRTEIHGLDNLPKTGSVILAANHIAGFDALFMAFAIPRHVSFMTKLELFANPMVSAYFRRLGGLPTQRDGIDRWAINYVHNNILSQGHVLGIFPEGWVSHSGQLQAAKNGVVHMAKRAQVPIVPVAITGTQNLLKQCLLRRPLIIRIGGVIEVNAESNIDDLMGALMSRIVAMLPGGMAGVYKD